MEEYLRKLANHANLHLFNESPPRNSLGFSLAVAEETGIFPDVIQYAEDILQCLEVANTEINGPNAATQSTQASKEIPRDLVMYVNDIILLSYDYALDWDKRSLFTNEQRELLKQSIWLITQGWGRVVDGDFDHIPDEVRREGELRGIL